MPTVYKGTDYRNVMQLLANGGPISAEVAGNISYVEVYINQSLCFDSSDEGEELIYNPDNGKITMKLGLVAALNAGTTYTAWITAYDEVNVNGIPYGTFSLVVEPWYMCPEEEP